MCSHQSARSVAPMRPSLILRLAAAASTTAAALAASPPAHAADGVYGGTTHDGEAIVLKTDAKGQRLKSIVISWAATCSDGTNFPAQAELTPTKATPGFQPKGDELLVERNAKGRFAGTQLATGGSDTTAVAVAVKLDGKLSAKRASGTISADVTIADKATGNQTGSCKLPKTSWAAARAPGRIYGGSTSQSAPVVIRLNASRRRVSDVFMTWVAPCSPSGFMRLADGFSNFTVKSTGAFGAPFGTDVPLGDGAKAHVDYTFAGRVSKSAVKGTLGVKWTETDAAGASTPCDSGKISWRAQTG
jgi:hypothetical protein